jgi:hypothetical protein
MWIKQAYRDYYKPKLRRELKRDPEQWELDQRFEEIYSQVNCILLAGVLEGVAIYFYEILLFASTLNLRASQSGFPCSPKKPVLILNPLDQS